MPRSSPKFGHEPIAEFFYTLLLESGEDDQTGGDEMPHYSLFRFANGLAPEDVDEYNEKQSAYEDQINASETMMLCNEMVGAILRQSTDGFVDADLYVNMEALEHQWQSILDDNTLEQCDECQAAAEEIGLGMPIRHDERCTLSDRRD